MQRETRRKFDKRLKQEETNLIKTALLHKIGLRRQVDRRLIYLRGQFDRRFK